MRLTSERKTERGRSDAVDGVGAVGLVCEDEYDAGGECGGGFALAVGAGAGGAILLHTARLQFS